MQLTKRKVTSLKKELKLLINKREEIRDDLMYASEQGDFYRENFPFQVATENLERNEKRIKEIENILTKVKIIEIIDDNIVAIGSKVEVLMNENKKVFEIVGTNEADPIKGRISIESDIGKILIGKRKNDKVQFRNIILEIISIS